VKRREKTVLIIIAGFFGLVVIVNVGFRLFASKKQELNDVDCIVALRRLSTALAAYALKHNGEYPKKLSELNTEFACEPLLSRCPITDTAYQYLPLVNLGVLFDIPLLWCDGEHGSERTKYNGRSYLVVYSDLSIARVPAVNLSFERKWLQDYQAVLESSSNERLVKLRDMAQNSSHPLWLRKLALWRLGEEQRSDSVALIEPFLDSNDLAFEAAVALAKCGSPLGVLKLFEGLKSDDYDVRRVAYSALKNISKEDFNYYPEISPSIQEEVIRKWEESLKKEFK
jgi:hypothetical protein